jgi:hypothetical protein
MPKIDFTQYGLIDLKSVRNAPQVTGAWDKFLELEKNLPPHVSQAYYQGMVQTASKMNIPTIFRVHPDPAFKYPLSPNQIQRISQVVEDNAQAYLYETMGHDLSRAKIRELKKKGILDPKVERMNFPKDIYMYGRAVYLVEQGLDYKDAIRMARRNPLSNVEKVAIDHLQRNGMHAVTGLANKFTGTIKDIVEGKGRDFLREMQAKGMKKKMTYREIASEIGHATDDWARDLFRITYTEGHSYSQLATALELEKTFGTNPVTGDKMTVLVAKLPEPDACKYCFKLYVEPDGSLKVFKLDEMMQNPLMNTPYYDDQGKKVTRYASKIGDPDTGWLPVIGATHPYCRCKLVKYFQHLYDRKYIENAIKAGTARKNELSPLDKWRKGFEENWKS